MILAVSFLYTQRLHAQGLQATFGQSGIQTLSYNDVPLINLGSGLGDPFQIWDYNLGGTAGFGGTFNSWDPVNQILTYTGAWGNLSCQFQIPPNTDNLVITIVIQNTSSQTLNGINIYPLGLQLPQLPNGWGASNYPQFHNNLDGPSLISADYGTGMFVLADSDAQQLYLGFSPSGAANHYSLVVGSVNDASIFAFLASAIPVNRPIPAGGTDTYSFSLRFAPSGTDYHTIAGDVFTTFGQSWPSTTASWSDHRAIGSLFMTSSTSGYTPNTAANPRNYWVASSINIQTPAGLAAFQQAVLSYATNSIAVLQNMNAQGAIVWDLEGQQFPQDGGAGPGACGATPGAISYVGSPDMLSQISPEMDSLLPSGQHLSDAFFQMFTSAGLKCGMTLRPETVVLNGANSYQNWCQVHSYNGQGSYNATAVYQTLLAKAQYANTRWGCTLFYVDSDGGPNDSTAPSVWMQLSQAMPGSLFFPENIWTKDWAYSAPYLSFDGTSRPLHTPSDDQLMWPKAFAMTYIGDAPNQDLTNNPNNPNQWNQFVQAVQGGDILSFRAWYDDEPLNGQVKQIYQQAGVSAPTTPTITLAKSASPTTAKSGDTVTFTIQYQNTNSGAASNVVITDEIPSGTTLVARSITAGGTLAGNTITWTIGSVPGSGTNGYLGTVSFQVTVN